MIVVIKEREIREGAKGDYLYIKYTTEKGKESGKAVFSQLREKWELCQPNKAVNLTLDEKYNVVDINEVGRQLPPAQQPGPVTEIGGHTPPKPEPSRSQEIGEHVAFKSISDLIVAGIIKPEGATKPYWMWYWLKLSHLTGTKAEKKDA